MEATVQNLFLVYNNLMKADKSLIIEKYTKTTNMSDDTFLRRIRLRRFGNYEKAKVEEFLKELFPDGFEIAEETETGDKVA